MLQGWIIFLTAIVYIGALFAVANYGDSRSWRKYAGAGKGGGRPYIYAFSLAVYCTTWTIFGSVGFAASSGLNFTAIYLGPILIVTVGYRLLQRVVSLSKSQRITSVADFIGARYGKSAVVGGVAAIIAVIGTVPYIALQLKAISNSVSILMTHYAGSGSIENPILGNTTLVIAVILAVFAILFGTRHADATEHQHGMMLAVAMESVVKLLAFVGIGIFVTYFLFDGFGDLFEKAQNQGIIDRYVTQGFDGANFTILLVLSALVFLLLPRQFHVAVVENNSPDELAKARWLFPLYLVAINIFVIPIALAGLLKFGDDVSADNFVLALPMSGNSELGALAAFLGGLSAGTAMVIVASVALAIMVSNHIVLPLLLKQRADRSFAGPRNMEQLILNIRRTTIFVLLMAAYYYYQLSDNSVGLVSIGLISFAAIAQLAPAFFGGLFWRRANARGALLGMSIGFVIWAFTLLLPTLLPGDHPLMHEGLFAISWLRPQHLFFVDLSPLGNGVFSSLLFNTIGLVIGSLSRQPNSLELIQSSVFVQQENRAIANSSGDNSNITIADLMETVAQYLGDERTNRSFDAYKIQEAIEFKPSDSANTNLFQFSEQLLASAVGASSSRLVHSLLVKRFDNSSTTELKLLDDASQALQFNRGVLQTALDQIEQGICVFDSDYRLSCWNKQFREMLNLPASVGTAGTSFSTVIRQIVERNKLDQTGLDEATFTRNLVDQNQAWQFELPANEKQNKLQIVEVSSASMPSGGLVLTWQDNTQRVLSAKALSDANVLLERRVSERTIELTDLNKQLEKATNTADQANQDKTRFLAAAGHDILQPLNAARLYSSTLIERLENERNRDVAASVNKSLDSVEDILGAVLAISHLDASTDEVKRSAIKLNNIFEQLKVEFQPIAAKENLELVFVQTSVIVNSDPSLLKRLLQNLISNAIKYTSKGKILIGVRGRDEEVAIEIHDTGIGIAKEELPSVFKEFKRLTAGTHLAPGLGLGLSIVERISKRLGHKVSISSIVNHGTRFQVSVARARGVAVELAKQPSKTKPANNILPGLKVLCVDNDATVLKSLSGLLEQWDCAVLTATSSDQALKVITSNNFTPDILLMDYHLNDENGLEAIGKIREHLAADLNAVLVTANRSRSLLQTAENLGLIVINKSIKPAALRSVLASVRRVREAAQ